MTRANVVTMAEQLRMRPAFVLKLGAELAAKLPEAVALAVKEAAPALPPGGKVLADRLQKFALSTTQKAARRFAA